MAVDANVKKHPHIEEGSWSFLNMRMLSKRRVTMKYKIKDQVRIREEEGFFLIVNLTTEDMLSGYPAFFKANSLGKKTIDIMNSYLSIEEIVDRLLEYFPQIKRERLRTDTDSFISSLKRYSLIEEEDE